MILNDGTIVYYVNYSADCEISIGVRNGACGYFYADINGRTKPNTIGKDVFLFSFSQE